MIKKVKRFLKRLTREQIVFWFFILWALIIMSKVFSYTILNYDFYKELADKQQIWKVEIPVTRWDIYSSNNTSFARSVNLNDLAIDPTVKWDKAKLIIYLRDLVYNELCENTSNKSCYEWVLKFTKKLEIEDFKYDEKYIKDLIINRLKEKSNNLKVTSVLLEQNIDPQTSQKIKNLWLAWVYLNDWNLYINPEEVNSPDLTSQKLAQYINIPQPRIKYLIRKRVKRYIPILKKLSIDWYEKLKSYLNTEREALKRWILQEEKSIVNFIILTPYPQRFYPEKSLASQVIGFVDNSWIGHYWLEWYFNKILKWNDWYIIAKKDIKWRTIDPISLNMWDIYWEWAKIYTTIDRNIQKKVESILEQWVKKYRANKGTVVVLNPKTWEVIAMANYPSFDLNNPWDVYELEKVNYFKYPKPEIDLLWIPVFIEDNERGQKFYYDSKEIFLREANRSDLTNYALVKYKYKNDFGPW
jgi:cell division protein FtsI/penicillin-binding protein 2